MKTIGMIAGGIFGACLILLLVALLCRAALALADAVFASPPEPVVIVKADFPVCVTIKPPPLRRALSGKYDFRADPGAFNDKGIS